MPKTFKNAAAKRSKPVTAFALFSGAGGLQLGLEQAGIDVLVASDIEPEAEKTHKANWPTLPFIREDARRLTGERLLAAAGGRVPDLIAGGPPCQGFSTLGDKLSADPRNVLFDAFARIVEEVGPRFVLIENVKSMVTMYGGRFRDHVLQRFESLGYAMSWRVLDAADYGAPQFRNRVIFFGTRHGAPFSFPRPTYGPRAPRPHRTTWDAIADLADQGEDVDSHIPLDHSEKVIARYRLIPEGGRLPPPEQLPVEIRRRNFGNTYKRLHRERPALTMVPGNNAFPVHPVLHRSLTPREAARLQGFPDSFAFTGDRRRRCILVGNAVPPPLGKAVGRQILKHASALAIRLTGKSKTPEFAAPVRRPLIMPSNLPIDAERGFVDLFCGAGGFTIGLHAAGWAPLAGVDINPNVALTCEANYPGVAHLHDDLGDPALRDRFCGRYVPGTLGLVVGGPPCQGFSMFGKRRFVNTRGYNPREDARNRLVFAFIDVVRRLQPRWFIMENVPGLANLDGGLFLHALVDEFKRAGYNQVEVRVVNCADYGVPQLRKRLLIIGNRTGHIIPWPKKKFFADPREWQEPYRTVGEAIMDLATPESHARHTCHVAMNHKPLLVERYRYIPEGGRLDVDALPAHLRTGYRTNEVKNYSHVFKRLHRDRPAWTMVPGHNAFPIHPCLDRALTVREAARIQTFPDALEFKGSRQEQCIQVGNAFPPLLAELIGNNIKKAEANGWYPGRVPRSAYYALVEAQRDPNSVELDQGMLEVA